MFVFPSVSLVIKLLLSFHVGYGNYGCTNTKARVTERFDSVASGPQVLKWQKIMWYSVAGLKAATSSPLVQKGARSTASSALPTCTMLSITDREGKPQLAETALFYSKFVSTRMQTFSKECLFVLCLWANTLLSRAPFSCGWLLLLCILCIENQTNK